VVTGRARPGPASFQAGSRQTSVGALAGPHWHTPCCGPAQTERDATGSRGAEWRIGALRLWSANSGGAPPSVARQQTGQSEHDAQEYQMKTATMPSFLVASVLCMTACTAIGDGGDDHESFGTVEQRLSTGDIVLHPGDGTAYIQGVKWVKLGSASAASGAMIKSYNLSGTASATVAAAANPADYFEMTFQPKTGKDYRVWIRGSAEGNNWWNDSVSVQFSNATIGGNPAYPIGGTAAANYTLQDCAGAPLSGWGWQQVDSFGSCGQAAGPVLRFTGTTAKIRVQIRQDGLAIDQIVIADASSAAPGSVTNDNRIYAKNTTDTTATSPSTLRVLTFNVYYKNTNYDGTAKFIAAQNPDVIMLQEASYNQPAWRTSIQNATGKPWYSNVDERSGDLMLSRYPVSNWAIHHVSQATSSPYYRTVVRGTITVGGNSVTLFNTHLEWPNQDWLEDGMNELINFVGQTSGRKLIGGDFNAGPSNPNIINLRKYYIDTFREAYGSDGNVPITEKNGSWRPDSIYRSSGIRTDSAKVVYTTLSDHNALVADYTLQ
jgi:endonuclease/exonuclease/phosphatase family metal-dependent hydrolase